MAIFCDGRSSFYFLFFKDGENEHQKQPSSLTKTERLMNRGAGAEPRSC